MYGIFLFQAWGGGFINVYATEVFFCFLIHIWTPQGAVMLGHCSTNDKQKKVMSALFMTSQTWSKCPAKPKAVLLQLSCINFEQTGPITDQKVAVGVF